MKTQIVNVKTKKEILFYDFNFCGLKFFKDFYNINDNDFEKYLKIENKNILVKNNVKCEYCSREDKNFQILTFNENCQIDIVIDDAKFDEYFEII